ncbi:MAG TPA: alginate export family protein [Methylophilus sp.]|nr:alginate export family protein [Methylophilus sp.]HQQ33977.1 alginate export family protein [Methylophilus sp.]
MKTILKASVLAAIGSLYASLTLAADTSAVPVVPSSLLEAIQQGKPMTNFRLRYESVDQDGYQGTTPTAKKLDTAHAWTLRSLVGWQTAPFKNFSFAVQVTDVHEFNDDFNDRRHNQPEHNNGTGSASLDKRQYPNIVDPGYTDINQLYVDWTGIKNTKLRLGRQVLNLDNVRFIGDIAFRQNTQVFDGISVLNKSIPDTELFLAHFGKVRQITTKLRDGNIDILNAKYRFTPTESLTGYGYFIDVANLGQNGGNPAAVGTAAQGGNGLGGSSDIPASASNVNPAQTDASSKTFGLRLDGVHVFNPTWKGLYTAEYAKQTDYRGGSDLIDAHYYKIGGGVGYDAWSIRIDHEKLSSNGGKYAFQTPLGTNHLFQGWADHFLATPRQGMEDTFVTLAGSIEKAKLYAEYHVFHADKDFQTLGGRLGDKYGTEFDASVMYPFTDKLSGKLEYANFREGDVYGTTLQNAARKGDKEILWVTGMYTF